MQINTERLKCSRFIDKCNLQMCLETDGRRDVIPPLLQKRQIKTMKGKRCGFIIFLTYRSYKSVTKWHHTQITPRAPVINRWTQTLEFIQNLSAACIYKRRKSFSKHTPLHGWYLFSFTSIWEHKSYRKSLWGSCTACRCARLCARRMAPLRHTVKIQAKYIHEHAFVSRGLAFVMKEQRFEVSRLGVHTWIILTPMQRILPHWWWQYICTTTALYFHLSNCSCIVSILCYIHLFTYSF